MVSVRVPSTPVLSRRLSCLIHMHHVSTSRRSATTHSNVAESMATAMATVATAEASATATVQADRYSLRTSVWREYFFTTQSFNDKESKWVNLICNTSGGSEHAPTF